MGKNAYHIVSDLHDSDKNKENRFNYPGEIMYVKSKLIEICKKYKNQGYNNYIILLGDVFDRGFTKPDESAICNNFWVILNNSIGGIYSVLGNHEISFYKNNPFFTLMSFINSEKLKQLKGKICEPKGLAQVFNVVDRLEDGNVVFHFNHYGTPISNPESNKLNIGLYHQDIICSEILEEMRTTYNADIFESSKPIDLEGTGIFKGIQYNFFGHMHKVFGCYSMLDEKTRQSSILYYLGSLGRPNVTEVNDLYLTRDIPTIIVEDGDFVRMDNNLFKLQNRETCVNESIVEKNQEKYKQTKAVQMEKRYVPTGDDPVKSLEERCLQNETMLQLLKGLVSNVIDQHGIEIRREVGNFVNERLN